MSHAYEHSKRKIDLCMPNGRATARDIQRMIALDGLLNMHERAIDAGVYTKLNGELRTFTMSVVDCGTACCLHGSAKHSPWFKERDYLADGDTSHWFLFNDFFGNYSEVIDALYGCASLELPEVRRLLRQIIRHAGGEEAIQQCKKNRAQGDKLGMGISDMPLTENPV